MTRGAPERPGPYPALRAFLGAWFHQDFDFDGGVPDIVPRYAATASAEARAALAADIRAFLAAHPVDAEADAVFERVFRPDIHPAVWGLTAREWLARVLRLLGEG